MLYGGIQVSNWTRAPDSVNVWQAVLPSELVDGLGWAGFTTLTQGDRSCILARSPDFGSGFLPCSGNNAGFTCPAGVLPDRFDCVNASCSVFTRAGYSSDIRAVTGVDLPAHSVHMTSSDVDTSRGDFYLQGAPELLDSPGEWAVRGGVLFLWPYPASGHSVDPNTDVITAVSRQRVLETVGPSRFNPAGRQTFSNLTIVGAAMPTTYTYACRGSGPGASGFGADCAKNGGPASPDETNTSPLNASQGMVYLENATAVTLRGCVLRAGGIAGVWLQEANTNHTIAGNWVDDMGGFGLYANGVGVGDTRYASPSDADVNHGHTVTSNVFHDGGRQIEYGSGIWFFQSGGNTVTHNRIARFPRDGIGFYGMLPFFTGNPGGAVAPGMPPATPDQPSRRPWGQWVTWNGGSDSDTASAAGRAGEAKGHVGGRMGQSGSGSVNGSWSVWEVLNCRDNYVAYNDISQCNRQGLDGGVIESWGVSRNCTWERNALHDNEGYTALSVFFADDFSPSLSIRSNIAYANKCPAVSGANCAMFMMKSINVSAEDNVIADGNISRTFEVDAYRMPAANMRVSRNILFNTTLRSVDNGATAYTARCTDRFSDGTTWDNGTLQSLLETGDGTSAQRSRLDQYGFSPEQLAWSVVAEADGNFADSWALLDASGCAGWDRHSLGLPTRPFVPATPPTPWHRRTYLDYAIAPDSPLVSQHGFRGSFDVENIGPAADFGFDTTILGRRDGFGRVQAERYDRAEGLWTVEALGLGSSDAHFGKDPHYAVPPGSWARYDAVDFGNGTGGAGSAVSVRALAAAVPSGAVVKFLVGAPDAAGKLVATVNIPPAGGTARGSTGVNALPVGYSVLNGSSSGGSVPPGLHTVYMVFEAPKGSPPPPPADNAPHRYWRLIAGPDDFNSSFYNANWDVCAIELLTSPSGPNVATNPANAIASSGDPSRAFSGVANCTQYDGRSGSNSVFWHPDAPEHNNQWIGYDFKSAPAAVAAIRVKQFPQQYCAATPSLQYSDDQITWVTKVRLLCTSECPNNATASEPQSGWIQSPGPGTVAPPSPPPALGIGAVVDWFSFVRV